MEWSMLHPKASKILLERSPSEMNRGGFPNSGLSMIHGLRRVKEAARDGAIRRSSQAGR